MSESRASMDMKTLIHELKTNRKTQAAAVLMPLTLAYLIYSLAFDNPPPRKGGAKASTFAGSALGDQQSQALSKLPDLAKLDKAGEVPGEPRMYRDIFTFDLPAPPPPPPVKVVPTPTPKPPTQQEIEAEQLRNARQNELNAKPQTLRYLGYMGRASTGRIGAFMRGDDAISMRPGDMANPQWRLQAITETYAEFENLKYPDLHYRVETSDSSSNSGSPYQQNNQF